MLQSKQRIARMQLRTVFCVRRHIYTRANQGCYSVRQRHARVVSRRRAMCANGYFRARIQGNTEIEHQIKFEPLL